VKRESREQLGGSDDGKSWTSSAFAQCSRGRDDHFDTLTSEEVEKEPPRFIDRPEKCQSPRREGYDDVHDLRNACCVLLIDSAVDRKTMRKRAAALALVRNERALFDKRYDPVADRWVLRGVQRILSLGYRNSPGLTVAITSQVSKDERGGVV
jgi:hypothetical protein